MASFLNEAITLGVALLGAGLGVMNTWQSISANRVKLRVKPAYAIGYPRGEVMFSIEVVNLSNFAVTISDVGLTLDGDTLGNGPRAAVTHPIIIDGGAWPRRLEARQSVSVYFDPHKFEVSEKKIGRAYARTACDEAGYGTSAALKQLREIMS